MARGKLWPCQAPGGRTHAAMARCQKEEMIFWAINRNKASNRFHAYNPDVSGAIALCGCAFPVVMQSALREFPGRHVACRKCEAKVLAATMKNHEQLPRADYA